MEALVFSLFGVVVLGGLAAAVVWEVRHRVGSFKVNLTSARGTLETALHPADRVRVLLMLTSICLEHGTTEALGPLLDFLSKRIPRELSPGADGSPARGSPSPAPAGDSGGARGLGAFVGVLYRRKQGYRLHFRDPHATHDALGMLGQQVATILDDELGRLGRSGAPVLAQGLKAILDDPSWQGGLVPSDGLAEAMALVERLP